MSVVYPQQLKIPNGSQNGNFGIRNKSSRRDDIILFKIKTPDPKLISCRPNKGIIEPGCAEYITVRFIDSKTTKAYAIVQLVNISRSKLHLDFTSSWSINSSSGYLANRVDIINETYAIDYDASETMTIMTDDTSETGVTHIPPMSSRLLSDKHHVFNLNNVESQSHNLSDRQERHKTSTIKNISDGDDLMYHTTTTTSIRKQENGSLALCNTSTKPCRSGKNATTYRDGAEAVVDDISLNNIMILQQPLDQRELGDTKNSENFLQKSLPSYSSYQTPTTTNRPHITSQEIPSIIPPLIKSSNDSRNHSREHSLLVDTTTSLTSTSSRKPPKKSSNPLSYQSPSFYQHVHIGIVDEEEKERFPSSKNISAYHNRNLPSALRFDEHTSTTAQPTELSYNKNLPNTFSHHTSSPAPSSFLSYHSNAFPTAYTPSTTLTSLLNSHTLREVVNSHQQVTHTATATAAAISQSDMDICPGRDIKVHERFWMNSTLNPKHSATPTTISDSTEVVVTISGSGLENEITGKILKERILTILLPPNDDDNRNINNNVKLHHRHQDQSNHHASELISRNKVASIEILNAPSLTDLESSFCNIFRNGNEFDNLLGLSSLLNRDTVPPLDMGTTSTGMGNKQLANLSDSLYRSELRQLTVQQTSLRRLPVSLCRFVNITTLNLSNNQLDRLGPPLLILPSLTTLDVSCNQLSSLDFIGNCSALSTLLASCNRLCGLHTAITVLLPLSASLTIIDLSVNPVCLHQNYADEILTVLPNLISFDNLELEGNNITGSKDGSKSHRKQITPHHPVLASSLFANGLKYNGDKLVPSPGLRKHPNTTTTTTTMTDAAVWSSPWVDDVSSYVLSKDEFKSRVKRALKRRSTKPDHSHSSSNIKNRNFTRDNKIKSSIKNKSIVGSANKKVNNDPHRFTTTTVFDENHDNKDNDKVNKSNWISENNFNDENNENEIGVDDTEEKDDDHDEDITSVATSIRSTSSNSRSSPTHRSHNKMTNSRTYSNKLRMTSPTPRGMEAAVAASGKSNGLDFITPRTGGVRQRLLDSSSLHLSQLQSHNNHSIRTQWTVNGFPRGYLSAVHRLRSPTTKGTFGRSTSDRGLSSGDEQRDRGRDRSHRNSSSKSSGSSMSRSPIRNRSRSRSRSSSPEKRRSDKDGNIHTLRHKSSNHNHNRIIDIQAGQSGRLGPHGTAGRVTPSDIEQTSHSYSYSAEEGVEADRISPAANNNYSASDFHHPHSIVSPYTTIHPTTSNENDDMGPDLYLNSHLFDTPFTSGHHHNQNDQNQYQDYHSKLLSSVLHHHHSSIGNAYSNAHPHAQVPSSHYHDRSRGNSIPVRRSNRPTENSNTAYYDTNSRSVGGTKTNDIQDQNSHNSNNNSNNKNNFVNSGYPNNDVLRATMTSTSSSSPAANTTSKDIFQNYEESNIDDGRIMNEASSFPLSLTTPIATATVLPSPTQLIRNRSQRIDIEIDNNNKLNNITSSSNNTTTNTNTKSSSSHSPSSPIKFQSMEFNTTTKQYTNKLGIIIPSSDINQLYPQPPPQRHPPPSPSSHTTGTMKTPAHERSRSYGNPSLPSSSLPKLNRGNIVTAIPLDVPSSSNDIPFLHLPTKKVIIETVNKISTCPIPMTSEGYVGGEEDIDSSIVEESVMFSGYYDTYMKNNNLLALLNQSSSPSPSSSSSSPVSSRHYPASTVSVSAISPTTQIHTHNKPDNNVRFILDNNVEGIVTRDIVSPKTVEVHSRHPLTSSPSLSIPVHQEDRDITCNSYSQIYNLKTEQSFQFLDPPHRHFFNSNNNIPTLITIASDTFPVPATPFNGQLSQSIVNHNTVLLPTPTPTSPQSLPPLLLPAQLPLLGPGSDATNSGRLIQSELKINNTYGQREGTLCVSSNSSLPLPMTVLPSLDTRQERIMVLEVISPSKRATLCYDVNASSNGHHIVYLIDSIADLVAIENNLGRKIESNIPSDNSLSTDVQLLPSSLSTTSPQEQHQLQQPLSISKSYDKKKGSEEGEDDQGYYKKDTSDDEYCNAEDVSSLTKPLAKMNMSQEVELSKISLKIGSELLSIVCRSRIQEVAALDDQNSQFRLHLNNNNMDINTGENDDSLQDSQSNMYLIKAQIVTADSHSDIQAIACGHDDDGTLESFGYDDKEDIRNLLWNSSNTTAATTRTTSQHKRRKSGSDIFLARCLNTLLKRPFRRVNSFGSCSGELTDLSVLQHTGNVLRVRIDKNNAVQISNISLFRK